MNRCPTRSLEDKTPKEAWTRKKPNLGQLKVFGSSVTTWIPKAKRKKFDSKSEKGIFVGYTKGHRVYDPVNDRFHVSRDVVVLEEGVPIRSAEQRVEPVEFMELCCDEFYDRSVFGAAKLPEVKQLVGNVVPGAAKPAEIIDQLGGDSDDTETTEEAIVVNRSFSEVDDFEDACADIALPPQLSRTGDEIQQELRRSGQERRCLGKYSEFMGIK